MCEARDSLFNKSTIASRDHRAVIVRRSARQRPLDDLTNEQPVWTKVIRRIAPVKPAATRRIQKSPALRSAGLISSQSLSS